MLLTTTSVHFGIIALTSSGTLTRLLRCALDEPTAALSTAISGTTNMIRIYSQNVWKNYVLLDSLLESQKDLYDILFIQEPP